MSAPSMDGYASTASPIIIDGFKKTFYCHGAKKLLAVKHVLKEAPYEMILAGLGDYLGKVTALMDWQLSYYLNHEAIDFTIIDELYQGMEYIFQELGDYLTKRLIISGLHMSKVGHSRPASGSEHLISHVFEMEAIKAKKIIPLHGLKLGIASYKILLEYDKLLNAGVRNILINMNMSEDNFLQLEKMIQRGLSYLPIITVYYRKISEFLVYSDDDYKRAMDKGVEIRDRYTILTYLKNKWSK